MQKRAITGLFFVLVMIGAIVSGALIYAVFFLLLSLFTLHEFYSIVKTNAKGMNPFLGILLALALFSSALLHTLYDASLTVFLWCIPLLSLVFITELYHKSTQPFTHIGLALVGIFFIILPFICFFLLGFLHGDYNYRIPLAFLIMLWANDTGAYLTGKFFGKRKLFERHSPKKTWEGAIGGLFISLLSAYIIGQWVPGIDTWQWLTTSAIIAVFGTYGDLVESMLKRSYNIKDSGNILPGHGGLLDRFDGLLLSAPWVYAFFVCSL